MQQGRPCVKYPEGGEMVSCGGGASRKFPPWTPLRRRVLWILERLLEGGVGVRSGKGTLESEGVCEPCVGHL